MSWATFYYGNSSEQRARAVYGLVIYSRASPCSPVPRASFQLLTGFCGTFIMELRGAQWPRFSFLRLNIFSLVDFSFLGSAKPRDALLIFYVLVLPCLRSPNGLYRVLISLGSAWWSNVKYETRTGNISFLISHWWTTGGKYSTWNQNWPWGFPRPTLSCHVYAGWLTRLPALFF